MLLTILASFAVPYAAFAGEGPDHKSAMVKASEVIGMDLYGTDGQKLGDITDFVVTTSNDGGLEYVIVMTGGFVNFIGPERAIPAGAVQFKNGRYVAATTKQEFLDTPILGSQEVHNIMNEKFRRKAHKPYDKGNMELPKADKVALYDELVTQGVEQGARDAGFIRDILINVDQNKFTHVLFRPYNFTPYYAGLDTLYAVPRHKIDHGNWARVEMLLSANDLIEAPRAESASEITRVETQRGTAYRLQ